VKTRREAFNLTNSFRSFVGCVGELLGEHPSPAGAAHSLARLPANALRIMQLVAKFVFLADGAGALSVPPTPRDTSGQALVTIPQLGHRAFNLFQTFPALASNFRISVVKIAICRGR
jgi:hypothetical protein